MRGQFQLVLGSVALVNLDPNLVRAWGSVLARVGSVRLGVGLQLGRSSGLGLVGSLGLGRLVGLGVRSVGLVALGRVPSNGVG